MRARNVLITYLWLESCSIVPPANQGDATMQFKFNVLHALTSIVLGSAISFASNAAIIEFQLGTQFPSVSAGDNIPVTASTLPIGVLRFEDVGPQQVRLTVTSSLEASAEFFQRIVFNGFWDRPQDISFQLQSKSGTFNDPTVGKSNNAFTLNPPGGFDFSLLFTTSGTAANRFEGFESITYLLTCANAPECGPTATGANNSPLDATDFNVTNSDLSGNPGYNGWFAVASLVYPGADSNGARYGDNTAANNLVIPQQAVSEPSILATLGIGLLVLVFARRRYS
jgi:hypothetical protein